MDSLSVKSVTARGSSLVVDFEYQGQIEKFLTTNRFFARYNVPIHNVPEQFLLIPFLSTVCPVVWANHGNIYVKNIDAVYLDSLRQVQSVLSDLFPKIGFSGKVCAEKIVEDTKNLRSKSIVLFSGGVDSLATYVRHKEESPLLVAIHGAEVPLEDFKRWEGIIHEIAHFAKQNNVKYRTISSNFYELFDHLMGTTFYSELFEGSWWIAVMHSLSFVGLCAPLSYVDDVGKIYIASSLTKEFKKPRGCIPKVDNKVYWSGTSCSHDGYELSRQQKINLIADYSKKEKKSFGVRVCGKRDMKTNFNKASNCSSSKCEKCSRTIVGLELAGLDPNDYGFKVKPGIFNEIKASIENNSWNKFGYGEKYLWKDIYRQAKSHGDLPHPEAGEFVDWLLKINIETATSNSLEHQIRRVVQFVASTFRYVPNWLWRVNRVIYHQLVQ